MKIKNRFINNTSWILFGKIFQMVISLVVGMLVARYLGPTNYGTLNYVNSYVLFFTTLCNLGLNHIIVKELIDKPDQEGKILGSALFMRLIASCFSLLLIIIIIYIIEKEDKLLITIAFLQSLSLFFSASDVVTYWYQSKLKSKYVTFAQLVAYSFMSIYKIILILFKKDIRWFAFSIALDMIIVAIFLLILYRYHKGQRFSISISFGKSMLKRSYHYIIAGLMITIYGQIDKIMIGKMIDFNAVGLYSVAIVITGLWLFVPASLIESARPIIVETRKKNDIKLYNKRFSQLYLAIILLSISYGIFVSILSKYIILILYGKDYLGAISPLIIVVWYCSFSLIGSVNNVWLLCENKNHYVKWISLSGALINIVLNYFMIPIWGINGAAIATLLTQFITNVIIPFIIKDTRPILKNIMNSFNFKDIGLMDIIKRKG